MTRLAWVATLGATYLVLFGVGAQRWSVSVVGLIAGLMAAGLLASVRLGRRRREYLPGAAHVHTASPVPSAGVVGRCVLHVTVFAHGLDGVAVRILDPAVPVRKWPDQGATLPVEVNRSNPRRVRVLWDRVPTRGDDDLEPDWDSLDDRSA